MKSRCRCCLDRQRHPHHLSSNKNHKSVSRCVCSKYNVVTEHQTKQKNIQTKRVTKANAALDYSARSTVTVGSSTTFCDCDVGHINKGNGKYCKYCCTATKKYGDVADKESCKASNIKKAQNVKIQHEEKNVSSTSSVCFMSRFIRNCKSNLSSRSQTLSTQTSHKIRKRRTINTSSAVRWCQGMICTQSERIMDGVKIRVIPKNLPNCNCQECRRTKRKRQNDIINCLCHKYLSKLESKVEQKPITEQPKINIKEDKKTSKQFTIICKCSKKRTNCCHECSSDVNQIIGNKKEQKKRTKKNKKEKNRDLKPAKSKEKRIGLQQNKSKPCCEKCIVDLKQEKIKKNEKRKKNQTIANQEQQSEKQRSEIENIYKQTRKQELQIAEQEKQREKQQKQIDKLDKQITKQNQSMAKQEKQKQEQQKRMQKLDKQRSKQFEQEEQKRKLKEQKQLRKQEQQKIKYGLKSNKQGQQKDKQLQDIQKLKEHVSKLEQEILKVQQQNRQQISQIAKQNQLHSKQNPVSPTTSSCRLCKTKSQQSITKLQSQKKKGSEASRKSSSHKKISKVLLCECPQKPKSIFKTCSFKSCLSSFNSNTSRNITPLKSNRSHGRRPHHRRKKRRPGVINTSSAVQKCRCLLFSQSERLASGIKLTVIPSNLSNCDCKKCKKCKTKKKKQKEIMCWCSNYFQKLETKKDQERMIEISKSKTNMKLNQKSKTLHKHLREKKEKDQQKANQGVQKTKKEQEREQKLQTQLKKLQQQIEKLNEKTRTQCKGKKICGKDQQEQQKKIPKEQSHQQIKTLQIQVVKLEQKLLILEQQKEKQEQQTGKQKQKKLKREQQTPNLSAKLQQPMKKLEQPEKKINTDNNALLCECPKKTEKERIFKSCCLKSCLSIFSRKSSSYDVTPLKLTKYNRRQMNQNQDASEVCLCKKLVNNIELSESIKKSKVKKYTNTTCSCKSCTDTIKKAESKLHKGTELNRDKQDQQMPPVSFCSLCKAKLKHSIIKLQPQIKKKSEASKQSTSKNITDKVVLRESLKKLEKKSIFKTCSPKSCLSIFNRNTSRNVTPLKSNKSDGRRPRRRRNKRRPGVIDTSSAVKWYRAICTRSEQLIKGISFQVTPKHSPKFDCIKCSQGKTTTEKQKDYMCRFHKYFQKHNNKDQNSVTQFTERKIACGDVNNEIICNTMHETSYKNCLCVNNIKKKSDVSAKTDIRKPASISSISNLRKTIKCLCHQYYDKVQEVKAVKETKKILNNIENCNNDTCNVLNTRKDEDRLVSPHNAPKTMKCLCRQNDDKVQKGKTDKKTKKNIMKDCDNDTCNVLNIKKGGAKLVGIVPPESNNVNIKNKSKISSQKKEKKVKVKTHILESIKNDNVIVKSKTPDSSTKIEINKNVKEIPLKDQLDQTGEPFFAVKLNSIDMSLLDSAETLDKIKHFGKTVHYQGSCSCPSHKHLMSKYRKADATLCIEGPCDKAKKDKKTNFTCKCIKKRILHCSDSSCKETNKINTNKFQGDSLLINQVPLFEMRLDPKNMNITNAKEMRLNIQHLEKARLEGDIVCKTGVCKKNANKDNIKVSCFCKRSHNPIECDNTTCVKSILKKPKRKCKLCTIFRNRSSNHKKVSCYCKYPDPCFNATCGKSRTLQSNPCSCRQSRICNILKTRLGNNQFLSEFLEKIASLQNLCKNPSACPCQQKSGLCKSLKTTVSKNGLIAELTGKLVSLQNLCKRDSNVSCKPCNKDEIICPCIKAKKKDQIKKEKAKKKAKKEKKKAKKVKKKTEKEKKKGKKSVTKETRKTQKRNTKLKEKHLRKMKSRSKRADKKKKYSAKYKAKLKKQQQKAHSSKQINKEYARKMKNEDRNLDMLHHKEYKERKKRDKEMKKQFKSLQAQSQGKEETAQTSCCADFTLGVLKFLFDITKNSLFILFRLIFNPKKSYLYIKMKAQNPEGTCAKVKQWIDDYIAIKKLKMQTSIAGSEAMTVLVDTFQDSGFYRAFLAKKGKTKQERKDIERENQRRKIRNRKRDEEAVHGCRHVLLTTLRKRPCLWVYHICPRFYPQCLSFVSFYRQFTELCLFCLAVMFWTPCLMAVEACRFFVCCCLCTA